MMRQRGALISLAIGAALSYSCAARADDTPSNPPSTVIPIPDTSGPCWTIAAPAVHEVNPGSLVLLNGCTGATWMLVKTPLPKQKGSDRDFFSFQWEPLPVVQQTPVLSYPTMKELQQQFAAPKK